MEMKSRSEHGVDQGVVRDFGDIGQRFVVASMNGQRFPAFRIGFENGETFPVDRFEGLGRVEQYEIDRCVAVEQVAGEHEAVTAVVALAADDEKTVPC